MSVDLFCAFYYLSDPNHRLFNIYDKGNTTDTLNGDVSIYTKTSNTNAPQIGRRN